MARSSSGSVASRQRWVITALAGMIAILLAAWPSAAATGSAVGQSGPGQAGAPTAIDVVDANFQVEYEVSGSDLVLTFQLSNNKTGWMAVAFNEFFFPADTIVVWYDEEQQEAYAWDAYNPGVPTLPSFPTPLSDTDPLIVLQGGTPYDNQDNVELVSASSVNGVTTIQVSRPLITEDIFDIQIEPDHQFYAMSMYGEGQELSAATLGLSSDMDLVSAVRFADIWTVE